MKCYRCRRKGIDSIMIKEDGYAYCPVCGRETTYKTTSQKRRERREREDEQYYEKLAASRPLKDLLTVLSACMVVLMVIFNVPWPVYLCLPFLAFRMIQLWRL